MSRQISELEVILQQLAIEHRKLLSLLEIQQEAMKTCNLKKMDETANGAEACRLRIGALEQRRRAVVSQLVKLHRLEGEVTIGKLAILFPLRADALMKLRGDLKAVTEQVRTRTYISGRVAGAVLGHLNTVVRVLAGAVQKAGLYTKRGVPRVNHRIGVMEAVG